MAVEPHLASLSPAERSIHPGLSWREKDLEIVIVMPAL
jgi:hypothetical protein